MNRVLVTPGWITRARGARGVRVARAYEAVPRIAGVGNSGSSAALRQREVFARVFNVVIKALFLSARRSTLREERGKFFLAHWLRSSSGINNDKKHFRTPD